VRAGEWVAGLGFDASQPLRGDSLDAVLTWAGEKTPGGFPLEVVRLHFWLQCAGLYSFWFD